MTLSVDFDPPTATLVADPDGLDALLAQATGASARESGRAALQAARALSDDGRLHPGLAGTLEVMRAPELTARLSYGGRAAEVWVGAQVAALLLPADGDRRTLLRLHPSLVPEAVARAVDLQVRPVPPEAGRADAIPAADVVRRWTLLAGPPGARSGRALEVLETGDGLYVVAADQTTRPVRSTQVWRLIVRLVAGRRSDGLRPLPESAVLPAPIG